VFLLSIIYWVYIYYLDRNPTRWEMSYSIWLRYVWWSLIM
jgi:hypothetical protein